MTRQWDVHPDGTEMGGMKVLEMTERGTTTRGTYYTTECLCCGARHVVSHFALAERSRDERVSCRTCSSAHAARALAERRAARQAREAAEAAQRAASAGALPGGWGMPLQWDPMQVEKKLAAANARQSGQLATAY